MFYDLSTPFAKFLGEVKVEYFFELCKRIENNLPNNWGIDCEIGEDNFNIFLYLCKAEEDNIPMFFGTIACTISYMEGFANALIIPKKIKK